MNEFKELGLSEKLVKILEELRIITPTEIQAETIPLILKGKDVTGNAATGSGKTLAFASGIIEKITPGKGVQALVLTPTRELAEQIAKVTRAFSRNTELVTHEIFGGVDLERQINKIRKADIIIGTPGRILDHINRRNLKLSEIKILVLDEADRLVDMGFLPDVERIINSCSKNRQTLLFSATTSADIAYIEKKYMKNPSQISVEQYVDASKLKQIFYDVPNHMKFSLLVHLLKEEKSGITMIFCNTRRNVDLISMNLERYDIDSIAIHGGLDQKKRSRIIEKLHKNEAKVLVCTDVAARGLDIKNVTHVYNYDIPSSSEDYIHRIGRTARAGKKGIAVSIVTNRDYDNFRKVVMDDSLKIVQVDLPKMQKITPNFGSPNSRDSRPRRGGQYSRRNPSRRDSSRNSSGGNQRRSLRSDNKRQPRKSHNGYRHKQERRDNRKTQRNQRHTKRKLGNQRRR